jgi:hypothetical protein
MFVGIGLLILGMYIWDLDAGAFPFFIGFALAMGGAATAYLKAGEARRARAYERRLRRVMRQSPVQIPAERQSHSEAAQSTAGDATQ